MSDPEQDRVSRRRFLRSLGVAGIAGASGSLLVACGGNGDSSNGNGSTGAESTGSTATAGNCTDLSALSDQEKKRRKQMVKQLEYVEESPNEKEYCSNCQLYLKSEYGEGCGGCSLFPGPVHPNGYCNSWAPMS